MTAARRAVLVAASLIAALMVTTVANAAVTGTATPTNPQTALLFGVAPAVAVWTVFQWGVKPALQATPFAWVDSKFYAPILMLMSVGAAFLVEHSGPLKHDPSDAITLGIEIGLAVLGAHRGVELLNGTPHGTVPSPPPAQ